MVLRANFGSGLVIPLMAFVPNVVCLVALRFVLGAFAGTVTASQTLVSSNTPVDNRGFAMGTLVSAVYSGALAEWLTGRPARADALLRRAGDHLIQLPGSNTMRIHAAKNKALFVNGPSSRPTRHLIKISCF